MVFDVLVTPELNLTPENANAGFLSFLDEWPFKYGHVRFKYSETSHMHELISHLHDGVSNNSFCFI